MKPALLLTILLCIFLPIDRSCASDPDLSAATKINTSVLLRDSLRPTLVEFPSQALPLWRKNQPQKTTLLLLSQDPFLQPLPSTIQLQLKEQLTTATVEALTPRLSPLVADPLLLPRMTLRAALNSGYFSNVIWVFPSRLDNQQLNLERFRQQLLESGALSPKEADSLSQIDNQFHGQIASTPWQICTLENLTAAAEFFQLHIDLSYFQPLYQGEIKTPLYSLLYQTLKQLGKHNLPTKAISISLSNLDGNLPLSTRFIGSTLARLFSEPQLLKATLPENWETRRKALYLENFFQKEKIHELYQQLKSNDPQNASASYALYRSLRELKKGSEALAFLAEAVRQEPGYGLEYLTLAATALKKNRPDQSLKMFDLAAAAFPDNSFIQLQKAELLLKLGHSEQAAELLIQLKQTPWSPIYYPELPKHIQSQLASAK